MLRKPKGYDDVTVAAKLPRLPIGGYVIQVKNVKIEKYGDPDGDFYKEVLVMQIDIHEGEHAGFYKKNYEMQNQENKKWKGTLRLNVPQENDEEWKFASFKRNMNAMESSNKGYAWNWDENTLKGKICGALFRNKEWAGDQGGGWYTECFMLISADDVRNGNYDMPKDKPLPGKRNDASPQNESGYGFGEFTGGELQDDDIPF